MRHLRLAAVVAVAIGLAGLVGCATQATQLPPGTRTAFHEEGLATWYGPELARGTPTASGERYRESDYTAAHKTLPFGTRVLVENLRNGRRIVVRINDRGPYGPGRVIDVSGAAARALRMIDAGVVPVRLVVLR